MASSENGEPTPGPSREESCEVDLRNYVDLEEVMSCQAFIHMIADNGTFVVSRSVFQELQSSKAAREKKLKEKVKELEKSNGDLKKKVEVKEREIGNLRREQWKAPSVTVQNELEKVKRELAEEKQRSSSLLQENEALKGRIEEESRQHRDILQQERVRFRTELGEERERFRDEKLDLNRKFCLLEQERTAIDKKLRKEISTRQEEVAGLNGEKGALIQKFTDVVKRLAAASGFPEDGEVTSEIYVERLEAHIKSFEHLQKELQRKENILRGIEQWNNCITMELRGTGSGGGGTMPHAHTPTTAPTRPSDSFIKQAPEFSTPKIISVTSMAPLVGDTPTSPLSPSQPSTARLPPSVTITPLAPKVSPPTTPSSVTVTPVQPEVDIPSVAPPASSPTTGATTEEIVVTPKIESMIVDEDEEMEPPPAPTGPSIVIPLGTTTTNVTVTPVKLQVPPPPPPPKSTQQVGFKSKQLTRFAQTTKPHAINPLAAQWRCLCGAGGFASRKKLRVHITKMTKEWKHQCQTCKYYFFYPGDLKRHLTSTKCKPNNVSSATNSSTAQAPPSAQPSSTTQHTTADGNGNRVYDFVDDLLRVQTSPTKPAGRNGRSLAPSIREKRKLQQEFLRKKKHFQWDILPDGRYECSCGIPYKLKSSLNTHIRKYTTKEWNFKCDQPNCTDRFHEMTDLKRHLSSVHGLVAPLRQYTTGCYLCGGMFLTRKEFFEHRKTVHNLRRSVRKKPRVPLRPNPSSQAPPPPSSPPVAEPMTPQLETATSPITPPKAPPPPSAPTPVLVPVAVAGPSYQASEVVEIDDDDDDVIVLSTPNATRPPIVISDSPPHPTTVSTEHGIVEVDPLDISNDQFACRCGSKYLSMAALRHHVNKTKFGRIFECKSCTKGFYNFTEWSSHMSTAHTDITASKEFRCGLCGQSFRNPKMFHMHKQKEHSNV